MNKTKRSQLIPDYPHSRNRNSEPTYGEGYLLVYTYTLNSETEEISVYAHFEKELRFSLVDPNLEKLQRLPEDVLKKVLVYLKIDVDQDCDVIIHHNSKKMHHEVRMQNSQRKRPLEFYHLTLEVGEKTYRVEIDVDLTMIHVAEDEYNQEFGSQARSRLMNNPYTFLNEAPQCPSQVFRQCSWHLIKELEKVFPGRTIEEGDIKLTEYNEVDLKISELYKKVRFDQFKVSGYHLYLTYKDVDYTVNTDEYCVNRFCPTITLCRLPKHIHQIMVEQANDNLDEEINLTDITILKAEKTVWKGPTLETKQGLSKPTDASVAGYTIEYEVSLFKFCLKVNLQGTHIRFEILNGGPVVDSE